MKSFLTRFWASPVARRFFERSLCGKAKTRVLRVWRTLKNPDIVKRLDPGYLLKEASAVIEIRDRGDARRVF